VFADELPVEGFDEGVDELEGGQLVLVRVAPHDEEQRRVPVLGAGI